MVDLFYRTWMQTTLQGQTPLRQVCFPSSHDSGTYWFSNQPIDDPDSTAAAGIAAVVNTFNQWTEDIEGIPGIGFLIPDPPKWWRDHAKIAYTKTSQCTERDVRQQLCDGIRCLDLRIYFGTRVYRNPGIDPDFYVYHGLIGPALDDILRDINCFLAETTSPTAGEIVYLTLGHWIGFKNRPDAYDDFITRIVASLGTNAYRPPADDNDRGNLFSAQFHDVLTQNATEAPKSRVILVADLDDGDLVDEPVKTLFTKHFWPREYSPPNNQGRENYIYGWYSETTDRAKMISQQADRFAANSGALPFVMYLTLTPSEADVIAVACGYGAEMLLEIAGLALLVLGFMGGVVIATTLSVIAAALAAYSAVMTFSWGSLRALAGGVGKNLLQIANSICPVTEPGRVNFIYVDWYEDTDVVDLAIMYSAGGATTIGWHQWSYLGGLDGNALGSGATVTAAWGRNTDPPRLDIFQTSYNGNGRWLCYQKTYDPDRGWGSWRALEGQESQVLSTVMPVWGQDQLGPRLDVVMTGPESGGSSSCYWNVMRAQREYWKWSWSSWTEVKYSATKQVYGDPRGTIAPVFWHDGMQPRLDIFMSGTDGACWWNTLYPNTPQPPPNGPFTGWRRVELMLDQKTKLNGYKGNPGVFGILTRWITPAWFVDEHGVRLDLFMIGAKGRTVDSTCYWNVYRPTNPGDGWVGWSEVQNQTPKQKVYGFPGCPISPRWWTDQTGPRLDIFMSDPSGACLWNTLRPSSTDGDNGSFGDWSQVGESAISQKGGTFSPATHIAEIDASGFGTVLSLFVQNAADQLTYFCTLDAGSSAWSSWQAVVDNSQRQFSSLTTVSPTWSGAFDEGTPLAVPQLDLFVTDADQNCWWNWYGIHSPLNAYLTRKAAQLRGGFPQPQITRPAD